jgi:hypothetical protein
MGSLLANSRVYLVDGERPQQKQYRSAVHVWPGKLHAQRPWVKLHVIAGTVTHGITRDYQRADPAALRRPCCCKFDERTDADLEVFRFPGYF